MEKLRVVQDLEDIVAMKFGLMEKDDRYRKYQRATILDFYTMMSGDHGMYGHYNKSGLPEEFRSAQGFDETVCPNVFASAMNKVVKIGYNEIDYMEDALISSREISNNTHDGRFVHVGAWQDLPSISKGESYPDLEGNSDATNPFEMGKSGCMLQIPLETFHNDDTGAITATAKALGHTARKTLARFVWGLFINNALCNDGTAWFTAGHGNLGSSALSISAVEAAITALATMEQFGSSSDKMGINLRNFKWSLVVPTELWAEAVKINMTAQTYYTGDDLTTQQVNPCWQLFGAKNERIITPPMLTDSNDWAVVRNDCPAVELMFLESETPEVIFSRDDSELAFEQDVTGLKVRFGFGGLCLTTVVLINRL